MNIQLNLGHSRLVRMPPYEGIFLPEKLTVSFRSDIFGLRELVVFVKNGAIEGKHFLRSEEVLDLSKYCIAGKLEMEVHLVDSGRDLRSWTVEPLIIRDLSPNWDAVPEIEILKNEIKKLKTAIAEMVAEEV